MRQLKILYISVHEILEYDDLRLFTARGHRVFSLGAYIFEGQGGNRFRPPRPEFFDAEITQFYLAQGGQSTAFLNSFDAIIVNHDVAWLAQWLPHIEGPLVIYRTIGQSNSGVEINLKRYEDRVKIVRYSKNEVGLTGFAQTDAVIYFGKDLDLYGPWKGGGDAVTFHNDYPARSHASVPSLSQYTEICLGNAVSLYGGSNDGVDNWRGFVSFDDMQNLYKTCSSYLYTWTFYPSYTLSVMEALITGAPVIAPSLRLVSEQAEERNVDWLSQRYEVHELLADEESMLYDTIDQAREYVSRTQNGSTATRQMASRVCERARAKFDMRIIGQQWDDFFCEHVS